MIKGKCLCESVTIELNESPREFSICHCGSCQKWTGGVFMSVDSGSQFKIEGESSIRQYSSSDWAERGFCQICGSHLFFRMKKSNHYFFMLGLFSDQVSPRLAEQQFIDHKPSSYNFAEESKTVTSAKMHQVLQNFLSGG